MNKIEIRIDKWINKVIKSNFNDWENESSYWDRHWNKMIDFFIENKKPFEIKDEWWKNLYDEMLNFYEKEVGWYEKKVICELWAWSGYLSLLMAQKWAKVYLVDFSQKSFDYTKLLIKYLDVDRKKVVHINWDFIKENLNIPKCDIVWNCWVLEHYKWDKALMIIQKMKKYTKIWWKVMITLPHLLSPVLIHWMIVEWKWSEIYYSHKRLKKIMIQEWLVEVKVKSINYWLPTFLPYFLPNFFRKINITKIFTKLWWLFNGTWTVDK